MKIFSDKRTFLSRLSNSSRMGGAGLRAGLAAIALAVSAWASGTFGTVVSIGGHAADIALDEGRGVLYIANYTANRVEVMNTSDRSIPRSINIPYPGSLAVSRDGKYLVVASYGNFQSAAQSANTVTIVALDSNTRSTVSVSAPPLGVAFGADGLAFILTASEADLLDPASGTLTSLGSFAAVAAQVLPIVPPDFPPQILTAALGVSGDGQVIYGVTDHLTFAYSVANQAFIQGSYTASPTLGPRVVSVNNDGSLYVAGWSVSSAKLGIFAYQFSKPSGTLNLGSHAIDSSAGLVYAQIPDPGPPPAPPTTSTQCFPNGICVTLTIPPPPGTPPPTLATPPNLMIADLDNLTVRQRLLIPENLAGRSILNSARDTLYSISDSGITVFPVGALNQTPQLVASQEDLVFPGAFCDRHLLTKQITIADPNGGHTDFRLSLVDPTLSRSISFSSTSGVTPATITVTVDPSGFQNVTGAPSFVRLDSDSAVNLQPDYPCPKPSGTGTYANGCFRLLIDNPNPDQRGTMFNVPGALVDLVADPARNRFYILRQDKNQVLIFDASSYAQIGALRTGSSPMQMAMTSDNKYLLVGHDDAQFISVFDLDAMQPMDAIRMPPGSYPRSVAVAGGAILAASRVTSGSDNQISFIDFDSRTATPFPTLGAFKNSVNSDTVLTASPHGAFVMAAMPEGNVMLYDANAGTFTVARKDYPALSGAYAASDMGQFVVDNKLMDTSLVKTGEFDQGTGGSSGFAFVNQTTVIRTTGPVQAGAKGPSNTAGTIERVDMHNAATPLTSTHLLELPLFPSTTSGVPVPKPSAFIHSLAPLANGVAIVSLTQSGFTVLPANFDAATAKPNITAVQNTSDPNQSLAGGGLLSVMGTSLSPVSASSNASPAPTSLANSCVTINGSVIPLFLVSPSQINGQLPSGVLTSGQLIVYGPGGVSDPFNLNVQSIAPSILQVPSAPGSTILIPAIIRADDNLPINLVNPIHKGDHLIIYASGLGPTNPAVDAGVAAPSSPPAVVLLKPVVTLGGVTCPVTFAGLAPGQIGIYQVNVNVPKGITEGLSIPLTISQGTSSSTVSVRVVE